jgi:HAD superfamily hydrolase (TIGR01509 family)
MAAWGVLWDMDGVLVDTMELHHQAFATVFAEWGVPFTWDDLRATTGMNNTTILGRFLGPASTPELMNRISDAKETRFRERIRGNVAPLPGVRELVEQLYAREVPQAVASSAPPANIDLLVDEMKLGACFAALISGERLPAKPAPDVFLRAAQRIGVAPEGCVVIEDSVAGVRGAKQGGMKCVAVTTSFPASALREADWVVASLAGLTPAALESLVRTGGRRTQTGARPG